MPPPPFAILSAPWRWIPNPREIKLAYADANFKRDEFEKIQLKGKLQKITVYEVTGLKDRWRDPAVIPPAIAAAYARGGVAH